MSKQFLCPYNSKPLLFHFRNHALWISALGLLTAAFQPAWLLVLFQFCSTATLLSNRLTGWQEANHGTLLIIPNLWVLHFVLPTS